MLDERADSSLQFEIAESVRDHGEQLAEQVDGRLKVHLNGSISHRFSLVVVCYDLYPLSYYTHCKFLYNCSFSYWPFVDQIVHY